jgi:hypothetical protein
LAKNRYFTHNPVTGEMACLRQLTSVLPVIRSEPAD